MTTTRRAPPAPTSADGNDRRGLSIVLALDGSEASLVARDLVANARWPAGSTVHALTAYQVPVDWTGGLGATMDWIDGAEDQVRDELKDQLRDMVEPITESGIAVRRHVVRGRPATAIIEAAGTVDADLVVVGSRGHSPLRSMLLGSVAAEVASEATCAVLVARLPTISRVLMTTDGSPTARAIPAQLDRWELIRGLQVDLVSVLVPDPPVFELLTGLYTMGDDRLTRLHEELRSQQQADLAATAADFSALGIPTTEHTPSGDATREIITTAEACRSDLIVVGSRGLRGIERMLLGSVARNVATHADCSVLVMRPLPVSGTAAEPQPQAQQQGADR